MIYSACLDICDINDTFYDDFIYDCFEDADEISLDFAGNELTQISLDTIQSDIFDKIPTSHFNIFIKVHISFTNHNYNRYYSISLNTIIDTEIS